MTTYTKPDPQPAQRAEADLARYSKDAALVQGLAWPCPWDCVAEGIYPDEVVYQLDTGQLVAVSVEKEWHGNIVGFHAFARHINEDGSTTLFDGIPVEVSWTFACQTDALAAFGAQAIINECYGLLLGDEPTLELQTGVRLIDLDAQTDANRSIRVHLAALADLEGVVMGTL